MGSERQTGKYCELQTAGCGLIHLKKKEYDVLNKDIVEKTKKTAELYFKDVKDEKPYDLWRAYDKDLAKDLSLFITGQMYAREKIPHKTRQLITIASLTVLSRLDELRLHIQAALNVGCRPEEIAEVIFQTFIYGGIPATNSALKTMNYPAAELRGIKRNFHLTPMQSIEESF